MTIPHTDIRLTGWVGSMPAPLIPYLLLMRLDRPIGIWLLLLPGWWSIAAASGGVSSFTTQTGISFALFGIGALIMRGAGCIINDLWDRDLDKLVERTRNRPLAAGTVSVKQALTFLVFLLALGLAILVQFPPTAILIGFLSLIPVILYPLAKRITWYPQAVLGLTFNIGALMGWASVTDTVPLAAWLIYAAGFFWILGYDTIYAHQDISDDSIIGIKSTARKFGDQSPAFVAMFYALAALLLHIAGVVMHANYGYFMVWSLAALHFLWQVWRWDISSPQDCLQKFRSNRDAGFIIFLAFLLGG